MRTHTLLKGVFAGAVSRLKNGVLFLSPVPLAIGIGLAFAAGLLGAVKWKEVTRLGAD